MADPGARRRLPSSRSADALLVLATLLVLVPLGALGWAAGSPSIAFAHDVLRGTTPADGATVRAVPGEVVLTFDEPALAVGTEIVVLDPSGSPLQDGAPSLVDGTVRQRVRGGPAGLYTVRWRVTSADGHPVSGTFAFTATSGSTSGSTPGSTSGSTSGSTPGSAPGPGTATVGPVSAATPPPASNPGPSGVVPAVVVAAVVTLGAVLLVRRRRQAPSHQPAPDDGRSR